MSTPIDGLPLERPRCPWCNTTLRPWVDEVRANQSSTSPIVRRSFHGRRSYGGRFDTMRCAMQFAATAYNAGFRRPDGKDARQALTQGGDSLDAAR
jgi:hypothetical protein